MPEKQKMTKYFDILLALAGAGIVLILLLSQSETLGSTLMERYINNFFTATGSENAVTAVYLNFRVFDTIFEALMLMLCVMEVINASDIKEDANLKYIKKENRNYFKGSRFLLLNFRAIYPVIVLIGFYFMMNGHLSPGGGFQGGAILATVLISHYIVNPKMVFNLDNLERFEQIMILLIILVPVFYVFMQAHPQESIVSHQVYMVILNTLIGLKVFAGLSVIFYWFVFYEGADSPNIGFIKDIHRYS